MSESPLRLVRRSVEFCRKEQWRQVPPELRGIYVLYQERKPRGRSVKPKYDVLYIGMTAAGAKRGIKGRLAGHARSKRKGKLLRKVHVKTPKEMAD